MLEQIVSFLDYAVWQFGIPVGDQTIPIIVLALLGTGVFLTLRFGPVNCSQVILAPHYRRMEGGGQAHRRWREERRKR